MIPELKKQIIVMQTRLAQLEQGLNAFPPELDARDMADIDAMQTIANKIEHQLSLLIDKGVGS